MADVWDVGLQSEDCLQLNIFSPGSVNATTAALPVMLWVHGGGFVVQLQESVHL